MSYFLNSISTLSFWRYALLSREALAKVFALVCMQYVVVDMADFFKLYTKDEYSQYAILGMLIIAVLWVLFTRRPIMGFSYKVPGKDYAVEVQIGDLFEGTNDVIVSTNTTFDTNMASGLIDTDSVQGQVATRFFNANTDEIDQQLAQELAEVQGKELNHALEKATEYPIGTVARVKSHNRTFYFVAMSRLNSQGTAGSTPREIEDAIEATWSFIRTHGSINGISIPLMGTGRGRTGTPRKKMVERIAHSFAEGSKDQVFCNKLSIFIRPQDAQNFVVNLYQIRDYLVQSLHD